MRRPPKPNGTATGRPRHRTPGRVAFVALALLGPLVGAVGTAAPVGAQEISVTRLQRDIADNSRRIDELARAAVEAQQRAEVLSADITATEDRITQTRAEVDALRERMRGRVATLYVTGRVGVEPLAGSVAFADAASARQYGDGVTQADRALQEQLTRSAEALAAEEVRLRGDRDRAEAERADALKAKAATEDLLARQRTLLAALDVIPVMGTSRLTARQIADWFAATGITARLSDGLSIRELAEMFLQEGADEGVRGDVAFAQSVLETGYFRWATDNNYAGIGACDSCQGEPAFPSPRDGVRAQIQFLKNYADPDSRASGLRHPPVPTLWGSDPVRAARTFDTHSHKGRAQTWQAMGKGNWATDPNYATKVIGIYVRMTVHAADHG